MKHFIFSSMVLMMCVLSLFAFTAVFAQGDSLQGPPTGSGDTVNNPGNGRIPNPLGSDVNNLIDLVKVLLTKIVLPIGVVVVVFMVIYTGYKFVMAGGNPKEIEEAKRMLLYVLIGSAILLGSVVIADAVRTTVCKIAPNSCSPTSFR